MTTTIDILDPYQIEGLDRREDKRRRVLRGARLTFNKGYGAFECIVRNESEKGARLSFGETSAVPSTFDLEISGDRVGRRAVVRWRSETEVGVSLA